MFSAFFLQFDIYLIYAFIFIIMVLLLFALRKIFSRSHFKPLPTKNTIEQMNELNAELEPAGFTYDLRQDIFYSLMECWQREFGYCRLYDDVAPSLSMIIDSEPVTFQYNGKKWLIEFWKGQYGMTTGGEIGIYNTTETPLHIPGLFEGNLYHSADDSERLYMSFTLRRNGEVLFTRNDLHWWLTGFKLGLFTEPNDLAMDIRITFPNRIMCNAFVEGMYKIGYTPEDILIRYHTVFFTFDKPRTRQPESRSNLTEYLVQKNNKLYCETYEYITRDYKTTLDKLAYLKVYSPKMFATITRMGSDRELYRHFNLLKSYEDRKG